MTRLGELLELYEYNAWAMRRTFEATSVLSPEELTRDLKNSFPSVRDTLIHIVGAEWVWLTRWQGTSPAALPNKSVDLENEQIAEWWEQVEADRHTFLTALTPESLDNLIAYTNFAGKPFAFPLWQMLRHLVNHSSYHRGQVTTMLKQLGRQAIATDLILMYQERYQAPVITT